MNKMYITIGLILLGWILVLSGCSLEVGKASFSISTPEVKTAFYRKAENNGEDYLSRQAEQPLFITGHKNALAQLCDRE